MEMDPYLVKCGPHVHIWNNGLAPLNYGHGMRWRRSGYLKENKAAVKVKYRRTQLLAMQHTGDALWNCTPEANIILLMHVTPINLIKTIKNSIALPQK